MKRIQDLLNILLLLFLSLLGCTLGKIILHKYDPNSVKSHVYQPGDKINLEYIYHTTCTYNGVRYAMGEFRLSDCVSCYCNGTTGVVTCSAKDCPKIPNCVTYDTNTTAGDCCPKCLEYGCTDGSQLYKPGEKIAHDACTKCYCPWEAREEGGAEVKCWTIECSAPRCVDSVVPQGHCCPICPNGPNCMLENQIISDGERIYVDKCRYCYCTPYNPTSNQTTRTATCERSFFCI